MATTLKTAMTTVITIATTIKEGRGDVNLFPLSKGVGVVILVYLPQKDKNIYVKRIFIFQDSILIP